MSRRWPAVRHIARPDAPTRVARHSPDAPERRVQRPGEGAEQDAGGFSGSAGRQTALTRRSCLLPSRRGERPHSWSALRELEGFDHDLGRWRGQADGPAHARPRQARRTVRRPLPHHRHRPLELRQLGAAPRSRSSRSTRAPRSRSTSRAAGGSRRCSTTSSRPSRPSSAPARAGSRAPPTRSTNPSTSSPTRSPDHVCIFGGDHVYKMDVRQMLALITCDERGRPTVAAIPVPERRGARVRRDSVRRRLAHRRLPGEAARPAGDARPPRLALASMGNYIFTPHR